MLRTWSLEGQFCLEFNFYLISSLESVFRRNERKRQTISAPSVAQSSFGVSENSKPGLSGIPPSSLCAANILLHCTLCCKPVILPVHLCRLGMAVPGVSWAEALSYWIDSSSLEDLMQHFEEPQARGLAVGGRESFITWVCGQYIPLI